MSPDLDALVQELRDEAVYDPIRHRAADTIERLHFDLQTNREEKQRAYRNRDMWKGQCERQAEELSRWRLRTNRDSLAKHLAALDWITLQEIRSTVGPADDANNWREYLGRADDLLAFISVEMAATPPTAEEIARRAREEALREAAHIKPEPSDTHCYQAEGYGLGWRQAIRAYSAAIRALAKPPGETP